MPRRHRSLTGGVATAALWALAAVATAAGAAEITGLDGRRLTVPEPSADFRQIQEEHLAAARLERSSNATDPDAWIWVGRRLAYLGRYEGAIDTFSQGAERFPGDARFLRHRGHRFITLRRLDEAVADLSLAARLAAGAADRVEPDGLPNALGIPTSTLKTNIWYHLGLALYLQGDFEGAAAAYQRCSALAANPDMLVASEYWLYLSLRRAGHDAAAAAGLAALADDLELIENDGYYELLQLFKAGGDGSAVLAAASADGATVAFPTTAYGVGAWHLVNGRTREAREVFTAVTAAPAIAAFGFIAAEAELARGF